MTRASAGLAAVIISGLLAAALDLAPAASSETILIPSGEFRMGALDNDMLAFPEERPPHKVAVKAFRIDRFEVSNDEYRRFLQATAAAHPKSCSPLEPAGTDHTPLETLWRDPEWNAPEKPVTGVNWFDAYAYCGWVGKRLPTEAEWEHAARGNDERRFPWGNDPPGPALVGNFADESVRRINPKWKIIRGYDDGFAHTAPVGSFPKGASPNGVEDMAGNVWEWVADWWSTRAYGDPNAPVTDVLHDPAGPAQGDSRVLRGGSWDSTANFLRTTARHHQAPTYRGISFGIRCAIDVP
jgi:iron(II)-dependent oxidoreductase